VAAVPLPAFALVVIGGLLLGLLAGRLRWLGAPLLLAGALWALLAPRPDLFVGADGQQLAVVADGRLYTLRPHRGGYVPSLWAERAHATADGRLADLPGAGCAPSGCSVPLPGGQRLLALMGEDSPPSALPSACGTADIVTSPSPLPAACRPRWLQLDRAALRETGAVAIYAEARRMDSVAARAGDHAWSPSALPGERPRLLGGPAWTGVVAE
jgi:competence protein ComEC